MDDSTFHYFAYGSNMLYERLRRRTPSASPIGNVILNNHSLAFRKQSTDGSGKCDVMLASHDKTVHGVVYRVNSTELRALDRAEGVEHGYVRSKIEVAMPDGKELECVYYYATDIDSSLKPYDWYKALVIAGLEQSKLPDEYRDEVGKVIALEDPEPDRPNRLEALEILNEYESTKRR
jgi:gamma-glutamylcyclotransferase